MGEWIHFSGETLSFFGEPCYFKGASLSFGREGLYLTRRFVRLNTKSDEVYVGVLGAPMKKGMTS